MAATRRKLVNYKTLHVTVLQLEMKGEWRSFANRWTKMGKKMVKSLECIVIFCIFAAE